MSDENSIRINFGNPLPVFPLDSVTLLPQQVLPLHVFEPRYRQMVERALDGAGQIAMAIFRDRSWKQQYHGKPPLKPAVCVGQIVQHEKLPDGRYNILLQGVCRARIVEELPADGERLYRAAMLEPLDVSQQEAFEGAEDMRLAPMREQLEEMLSEGPLTRLSASSAVLQYLRSDEVPTAALLELVAFALVSDNAKRYTLLAEGDVDARAEIIFGELEVLGALLERAGRQRPEDWPKGMSWN